MAPHWSLIRLYGARGAAETVLSVIRDEHLPVQVMLGVWVAPVDRRDSTGIRDWAQKLGGVVERHIPSITLDDLLQREKAGRIDFLSMDIEMAEPAALRGFDIKRWRPALVCIEANKGETREFIERYFADNGYLPVKAWRLVDPVNLWYVPGP